MVKVSIIDTSIKETVIIDPYIPINVKFGHFEIWEEPAHYIRFGDFRHSMLEVGFGSENGTIRSINLIGAKEIYIEKETHLEKELDFEIKNCEDGLIVFNVEDYVDKKTTDIKSELVVTTYKNDIALSFSNDELVRFVQNGKVKFGLNQLDEICCFIVSDLNEGQMEKLNWCLGYML